MVALRAAPIGWAASRHSKTKRAPVGRAVILLHDSLSQLQANLLTECLVTKP